MSAMMVGSAVEVIVASSEVNRPVKASAAIMAKNPNPFFVGVGGTSAPSPLLRPSAVVSKFAVSFEAKCSGVVTLSDETPALMGVVCSDLPWSLAELPAPIVGLLLSLLLNATWAAAAAVVVMFEVKFYQLDVLVAEQTGCKDIRHRQRGRYLRPAM